MKRSQFMRFFFLALAVSGLYYVCHAQQSFQLDSLYPKTWYAKATENCVQVWGALDQLTHKQQSPARSIDRAIGQLVFAQSCLDQVKKDQEPPTQEHVHYLSRVIGTIADRSHMLKKGDVDRFNCLKERIEKMKKRVARYLSKG